MKTVFFTIVDDKYYYPIGTHLFVNSFKRYHPDIDLVVFRQDMIDQVFEEKGINFYMAKPTFAKLLTPHYDRVINIDADTVILGRLDEVLDTEWDVGAVWNYNDYENASLEDIDEKMYVQAGMVGSTKKEFWDIWEQANKDAMSFKRQENDILNLVWYLNTEVKKMNRLIWDKDKNYLGCKSLGREGEFTIEGNKRVMCRGEQVKAYHHAKGAGAMPKLQFDKMGFSEEVAFFMNEISNYGKTERYASI